MSPRKEKVLYLLDATPNLSFIDPIWPHLIAFTQRIKGLINLIKLYVCLIFVN